MDAAAHVPVLTQEVLEILRPRADKICMDCTIGRAGHAALIAPQLGLRGRYVGLDLDPINVAFARHHMAGVPCPTEVVHANFADSRRVLGELDIDRVDLLMADLGFSSNQMDDPHRGLSFRDDGPLDMRFDPGQPLKASDLVNHTSQKELADLIWKYSEERLSRKIARKIAEYRVQNPIHTTADLAGIVREAYGWRAQGKSRSRASGTAHRRTARIDPATRTFMALRIAVNAELDALGTLLRDLPDLVRPGGLVVIISFHSLEDRMVKQAFRRLKDGGIAKWITKKPLTAVSEERTGNPRSRSAKLRGLQME